MGIDIWDIWEMEKENSCTKSSRILYQGNLTAENIPIKSKKTRLTAIRVPSGANRVLILERIKKIFKKINHLL
jgi:hypothetical protein